MRIALIVLFTSLAAFAADEPNFLTTKVGTRLRLRDGFFTGWDVQHMNRVMPKHTHDLAIGGLNDYQGLEREPSLYTITAGFDSKDIDRNFKGHFTVIGAEGGRLILSYEKDVSGAYETVVSHLQPGEHFTLNCVTTLLKYGYDRPCTLAEFEDAASATRIEFNP